METRCKRIRQVASPPLLGAASKCNVERHGREGQTKSTQTISVWILENICSPPQVGTCVHGASCERA